jgi:hypothetical protein
MSAFSSKITALFFLIAVFAPLIYICSFQVKQLIIQSEALEKLKTESLQEITISKDDVRWIKNGKELILDNRLFDVERFQQVNDSLILFGLFDEEETRLSEQLNHALQKGSADFNKKIDHLIQLLQDLFYQQKHSINFAFISKKIIHFKLIPKNIIEPFAMVIFPPPRVTPLSFAR